MLLRRALTFLAISVLAVAARAAPAPQLVQTVEGISEYRLDNGLQVLLVPDDSKPTTTVNMTYRVGSRHENYGETGMAHLLEHLLFKGSPRHPTVWAEFSKRGLRANGSTSYDRTNYFASFAADDDNLKWYLGWQADAMVNSYIARKDLDTEMTVVRNEMERGENDPQRIMWQRSMASLFDWHNYGKSTIGARSDASPGARMPGLDRRLRDEAPDVVVFGHTHKAFAQELGGVLYFNPGYAGKQRFDLSRSVAVMEVRRGRISHRFVALP